ncbi:MAG TPA: 50S ribosomal protein L10 [Cytophagaceae bacterium]|jgi:large subunit ribosomal protein L10
MTREEKRQIVEDLSQKLGSTPHFYITDASGMSVDKINKFRKLCYQKGIEYKVFKNSLIRKALETLDTDYASFDEKVLTGFSGILFADTGKAPAQLLKEFYREGGDKPSFKGASIDTALFIGIENLDLLTQLKSKDELIGDIIGLLQSPAQNVISALKGSGGKIAGILKTLSEKPE